MGYGVWSKELGDGTCLVDIAEDKREDVVVTSYDQHLLVRPGVPFMIQNHAADPGQ